MQVPLPLTDTLGTVTDLFKNHQPVCILYDLTNGENRYPLQLPLNVLTPLLPFFPTVPQRFSRGILDKVCPRN